MPDNTKVNLNISVYQLHAGE